MKVYLAGPINGCTDDEAKGWRERIKDLLPPGVGYLDPMARDYRGRELEPGIAREIVEGDKEDILNADVGIFYYERPSVGTAMEMLFAHEHGIPVVVIDKSGEPLSPWLLYHARRVTGSLEGAVAAAIAVAPK
jgi:nucleoside 2-deoxyribosyltransferase